MVLDRIEYSEVQLVVMEVLDLLADIEHAINQSENGPLYPERGITKESLIQHALKCIARAREKLNQLAYAEGSA